MGQRTRGKITIGGNRRDKSKEEKKRKQNKIKEQKRKQKQRKTKKNICRNHHELENKEKIQ